MATNVSSLRVQILGNASGLEAALKNSSKNVASFATSISKSTEKIVSGGFRGGDTLARELNRQKALVNELASARVSGGNVTQQQLDIEIAKERQLERRLEARKALLNSLRGTTADLPEVAALKGAAFYRQDTFRTEEQKLSRVKQLIQQTAAEEIRTGESRAAQLQRLIQLQESYTAAINNRQALISRVKDDLFIGPMPAGTAPLKGAASYRPENPRSAEAQLSRVRELMRERAAEFVRTGRDGSTQLARLAQLEAGLLRRIEATNRTVDMQRKKFAGLSSSFSQSAVGARELAAGSGRAAFVVNQLGFGLEDFLTQVGPMGIGGGLRAAGNNLSVVAASLNPTAGIIVGVGAALGSILIPRLLESASAAERLSEELRSLEDLRFELRLEGFEIPEVPDRFADNDELKRSRVEIQKQIRDQERSLANARKEFVALATKAMPMAAKALRAQFGAIFDQGVKTGDRNFFDALNALEDPRHQKARKFGAVFDTVGLSWLLDIPRNAFGAGVGDADVAKQFAEISERGVEAASALNKLKSAADSIPQTKLTEWLAPMQEGLSAAADEFLKSVQKHLRETREFTTEFLGDIGGRDGRIALVNAKLDKRLEDIDRLFPGGGNEALRERLKAGARGLAARDSRVESQGLAGGFEFGSREAISTLNKAIFSRDKTEDKIEKNTKDAAEALKNIDKKIGRSDRNADLVAGPPI